MSQDERFEARVQLCGGAALELADHHVADLALDRRDDARAALTVPEDGVDLKVAHA